MASNPESSKKESLLSRGFVGAFTARFIVTVVFFMFSTTLALIVFDIYATSPAEAGLTLGAYTLGLVTGRVCFVRYTDVIGRKKIMLVACGIGFVLVGIYFVPMPLVLFTVLRWAHGTAMGVVSNTLTTVGVASIPKSRFSEGVGYFSLSITVGTALGPYLGYFVLRFGTTTTVFVVALIGTALAFLTILATPVEEITLSVEERKKLTQGIHIDQIIEKKALAISIIVAAIPCACYIIITNFLNNFALEQGFYDVASLYFVVYAVCVVLFRPITGRLMDKKGDNVIMYPSLLAFAAGLAILAFCTNVWTLILVAVINAFGQGCSFSAGQAITARNLPPHRLSIASSTYFTLGDVGFSVGPVLFGLLVPIVGYSGMYLVAAGVMVMTTVIYFFAHGRKNVKPEQERDN